MKTPNTADVSFAIFLFQKLALPFGKLQNPQSAGRSFTLTYCGDPVSNEKIRQLLIEYHRLRGFKVTVDEELDGTLEKDGQTSLVCITNAVRSRRIMATIEPAP